MHTRINEIHFPFGKYAFPEIVATNATFTNAPPAFPKKTTERNE